MQVPFLFSLTSYLWLFVQERMFLSLGDLISLTILLSVTPAVREAASALARGDHKGGLAAW